jgi:ferredoxin
MLLAGGAFLVAGVWVARPYCRFLCPYGVLLKWASLLSREHVAITPAECVACRLCEGACPFGAIRAPAPEHPAERPAAGRRRLAVLLLLLPLLAGFGGWLGGRTHPALSRVHPTVRLDEEVRREELGLTRETTPTIEAFRQTATPTSVLFGEAEALRRRYRFGGIMLGAFVGLLVGGKLVGLSRLQRRTSHEPDRGECLSCGRCFESCPIDHLRRHGSPGRYAELLASLGQPSSGRAAKAGGGGAS